MGDNVRRWLREDATTLFGGCQSMNAANPFAQVPATPEPIIAQVRRQLEADGLTMPGGTIDSVADRAVRELWESRVKTFVPVLALRQAREMLLQLDVVMPAQPDMIAESRVPMLAGARPGPDVLALDGDVLHAGNGDALGL
jgi:hypothetical protein